VITTGRLGRAELDRIAAAVAAAADPHYPAPVHRLRAQHVTRRADGTLHVPDGPWRVIDHPNRRGAPAEDADAVTRSAAAWTAAGGTVDQNGRPVHPYWPQLLADPRIGLPTGPGVFWRSGPNPTVDAVVLRPGAAGPEVLLIRRRDTGRHALPAGYQDPADPNAHAAALRELAEETGLHPEAPHTRTLATLVPTGAQATLHAWTMNTVVLIEAAPDYLGAAVPVGGDDAADAAWHPLSALSALTLADRHGGYIERAVVAWRDARMAAC